MLNKKLIVAACLSTTILAAQATFAQEAPPNVWATFCPANAFISSGHTNAANDKKQITLVACTYNGNSTTYNGSKTAYDGDSANIENLTVNTAYWMRANPSGKCPSGMTPVDSTTAPSIDVAAPGKKAEPLDSYKTCSAPFAVYPQSQQSSR